MTKEQYFKQRIEVYKLIVKDLKYDNIELESKVKDLEYEVIELLATNDMYKNYIKALEKEIKELKK